MLVDSPPTPSRPTPPRSTGRASLLAGIAAVVAVVALGFVLVFRGDDQTSVGVETGTVGDVSVVAPEDGTEGAQLVAVFEQRLADTTLAFYLEESLTTIGYGPSDGNALDGVVVWEETAGIFDEGFDGVPLTEADGSELASRGADLVRSTTVRWDGDDSSRALTWYGPALTTEAALAMATARIEQGGPGLDPSALPSGWSELFRSDGPLPNTPTVESSWLDANGQLFTLVSIGAEVPLQALDLSAVLAEGDLSRRTVEIRGTTGLVVRMGGGPEAPGEVVWVLWHEGEGTHALWASGVDAEQVALATVARLQLLSPAEWGDYRAEHEPKPETFATTTMTPPSTATTGGADTEAFENQPPTAPGPGELAEPDLDGTATTSPPSTAGVETTIGESPVETSAVETTAGPPPRPDLREPAGGWTAEKVEVVTESAIAGEDYSVGIHWSEAFGLCLGAQLGFSALEGGYPVACEADPYLGGGGLHLLPTGAAVVYAYTPAAIDEATLTVGDTTYEATLHQVGAFEEFTIVVFEIAGAAAGVAELFLPGAIELRQDGELVGWG